jgi:16S rRNA (guanine1207-N2)-methyltransferase
MHDQALATLLTFLQQPDRSTLWVADENALDAVGSIPVRDNLQLLTNRYDVEQTARLAGHQVTFSDFDFSPYGKHCFRCIVYRISKEKPVVHHVLNHASRLLVPGGQLLISGLKNEGVKTFIEKCRLHFGNGSSGKHGIAYLGNFTQNTDTPNVNWLDDQDYALLRLMQTQDLEFLSKPGLFGWQKTDRGSAFLLEQLPLALSSLATPPQSMLDLGCGYGYLTLMSRHMPLSRRVATDNNAAALLAMSANALRSGLDVHVVADDAGASLRESFDIILCNPPFHQGFVVEGEMTEKFLRNTRRLLSSTGMALFVVNVFIALEQKAVSVFSSVNTIANNGAFKVVMLRP